MMLLVNNVQKDGRVKPIDTVARNALLVLRVSKPLKVVLRSRLFSAVMASIPSRR